MGEAQHKLNEFSQKRKIEMIEKWQKWLESESPSGWCNHKTLLYYRTSANVSLYMHKNPGQKSIFTARE